MGSLSGYGRKQQRSAALYLPQRDELYGTLGKRARKIGVLAQLDKRAVAKRAILRSSRLCGKVAAPFYPGAIYTQRLSRLRARPAVARVAALRYDSVPRLARQAPGKSRRRQVLRHAASVLDRPVISRRFSALDTLGSC